MSGAGALLPDWDRLLSRAARNPALRGDLARARAALEAVATRSAPVPGRLDGIETGVRQLRRTAPLETETVDGGPALTVPSLAEMLRIKAVLILTRNATRDYPDFVALAGHMGAAAAVRAMEPFDRLYPQETGQSALQQLLAQMSNPIPFDLDATTPGDDPGSVPESGDPDDARQACAALAQTIFEGLCTLAPGPAATKDGRAQA